MIDAEVGGVGANSFVSLEAAEAYYAARADAGAWQAASAAAKEQALRMAAQVLDRLPWHGTRATAAQALSWPRIGAPGAADGAVPATIQHAQCEEALAWLRPELVHRRLLQGAGVIDAQVSGAAETYRAGALPALLSAEARALLRGWLRPGGRLVTDGREA